MSNIYLNEFDRFIKHELKPLAYMRYGDDWLCFVQARSGLEILRGKSKFFLTNNLSLTVNPKIDYLQPAWKGVSYLGVNIWPHGRRLQPQMHKRISDKLTTNNVASYRALIATHETSKQLKNFDWLVSTLF